MLFIFHIDGIVTLFENLVKRKIAKDVKLKIKTTKNSFLYGICNYIKKYMYYVELSYLKNMLQYNFIIHLNILIPVYVSLKLVKKYKIEK